MDNSYTLGNKDDLNAAIDGLGQFCHNWCMDVGRTESEDDLVFRCSECEFGREDGKCYVKMFLIKHATYEQINKSTSMGCL